MDKGSPTEAHPSISSTYLFSTTLASTPLDPFLPLHLSPPSPLPALPSAHASSPEALLRLLRRARHHPRLPPLDLQLQLAATDASSAFRADHRLRSLLRQDH